MCCCCTRLLKTFFKQASYAVNAVCLIEENQKQLQSTPQQHMNTSKESGPGFQVPQDVANLLDTAKVTDKPAVVEAEKVHPTQPQRKSSLTAQKVVDMPNVETPEDKPAVAVSVTPTEHTPAADTKKKGLIQTILHLPVALWQSICEIIYCTVVIPARKAMMAAQWLVSSWLGRFAIIISTALVAVLFFGSGPSESRLRLHGELENRGIFSRWGFALDTDKTTILESRGLFQREVRPVRLIDGDGESYVPTSSGGWWKVH